MRKRRGSGRDGYTHAHIFMDTIAAISTAQGIGGIGVVRVSGEDAIAIADKVFESFDKSKLSELKGYRAKYGKVKDGDVYIDDAIALVYRAPHSFTGENTVEISCHGGLYITRRVLRVLMNAGAKLAKAGEFTKRAFLNGKIDLTQAEAIMDIISSKSARENELAFSTRDGVVVEKINEMRNSIVKIVSHLCAWADYPEDDIPQISVDLLKKQLAETQDTLKKLINSYDVGCVIKNGIKTVIIGRPNVGKSTLMNMLSGCERSIVTDIPGTTRDIIEETVMLGDVPLVISDTAGIRQTDNLIEKIGVDKAKDSVRTAGLVFLVVDGSEDISPEDEQILQLIDKNNTIVIINKEDKAQKIDKEKIKKFTQNIVSLSAKNQKGLEKLSDMVYEMVGMSKFDASETVISNERQLNILKRALECVNEAAESVELNMTLDATTVSLQDAVQELMELTGERASEKVVDEIFSRFCVGK